MPIEAVIRHDPSQIWVPDKKYAEEIIHLALIPICAVVQPGNAGHRRSFVGVRLDANARIVAYTEEIIDNFKALAPGGVVDGGDVSHRGELGGGMVFQERDDGNDARGRDVDGQLVLPDGELLNVFREAGGEVLTVGMKAGGFFLVFVGRIDYGGMKLSPSWN